MLQENVYLTLGCYGRKEDGFILCPSIVNRILKIDDSLAYNEEIWNYLEAVKLLDKPLININAIRNFIYRMQDRFDQKVKKLWSEHEFNTIERFMIMHKSCGLYIKLISVEEDDLKIVLEEPERVKIQGIQVNNDFLLENVSSNVVPIRSRR